jgi:hypothetical protein
VTRGPEARIDAVADDGLGLGVAPVLVARLAAAGFAKAVEHKILRGAIEIGAAIRDRSRRGVANAQPQFLEQILCLRRIARARHEEAQQFAAQFLVKLGESGSRGGDGSAPSAGAFARCPRAGQAGVRDKNFRHTTAVQRDGGVLAPVYE